MTKPVKKILVANRGEIACRIISTIHRMGLASVAVYSEADEDALHVERAGEAVLLGPPPAAQSYLAIDKILAAARATGADAIHPGYGFLAENAEFAAAAVDAGLIFIGPHAEAIRLMGDKITSKELAQNAGVQVIPGALQPVSKTADALKLAKQIGYPVMLKAAAGGGGKGMRVARRAKDIEQELQAAMREAQSSFGDDRIFLEKFIESPRHIEIQILCDKHGQRFHLGERECSLQRRNQKIIEEAPSPFLDAKTRAAMCAQSLALAKAVKYDSAGTVEFVVDAKRNFYFLEMNTRLQVEHPVTEFITGLDLVEQMILAAAGEKLALKQTRLAKPKGWAIEARICAEDPRRDFMPSAGSLERFSPPAANQHIRLDTGVEEGRRITPFYDPMIAKLIAYAPDRKSAIAAMENALDHFSIKGIENNLLFLAALCAHSSFRSGAIHTGFIAEHFANGFTPAPPPEFFLPAAVFVHQLRLARVAAMRGQAAILQTPLPEAFVADINGKQHKARIHNEAGGLCVQKGKTRWLVKGRWQAGLNLFTGSIDKTDYAIHCEPEGEHCWRLRWRGALARVQIYTPLEAALLASLPERAASRRSLELLCPMPGQITQIHVREGQKVRAGEPLVSVEAMKMENILRADEDCTIKKILHAAGDTLALNDKIMTFA